MTCPGAYARIRRPDSRKPGLSQQQSSILRIIRKEAFLLIGFLFLGLVVLPIAIYAVGDAIFGEYGGHGYRQFFGDLSGRIRDGDRAAWFLVLSPYVAWQTMRLIGLGWRLTRRPGRS